METDRILLRPWRKSDAELLYKHASDPEVGPRAGWPPHTSVEESLNIICTVFHNDHTWAIVLKDTEMPIGCMGYYPHGESNIPIGEHDAELGYWVARPYWNRGICTEALLLMIDYCFREKGFRTLWCDHFVDNPASGRVMEKCCFRDTGEVNHLSHLYRSDGRPVKIMKLEQHNMKHYEFDEIIDRRGSDCFKWDAPAKQYGRDDLTPMWVADMDFRSPDFVMEAIRKRCNHEVLGYTMPSEAYWQAVTGWLQKHYNIQTTKEELHFIPGIVAGISYALLCLTNPGDKVLVTTPVYPPFLNLPKESGRKLVCSPLKIENGRFAIDFEDFERKSEGCKLFIMSNPHNPAGTVWGKEVLQRIADICERKDIIVISDEIHADLTLPPHKHVSYSTVSETAKKHSLTFMAPSKTFNIAGLGSSVCYIADEELRRRFFGWLDGLGVAGGNIFAFTAAEAAFAHGEEWLRQMLTYLNANVQALDNALNTKLPNVKAVMPEASYLAWLDFSAYGIPHKVLADRLLNEAKVVLNDGTTFGGDDYNCCFRINLGCPKAMLVDALGRMAAVVNK